MMGSQIRALEGEGRQRSFQLSFSSEEPYERTSIWGDSYIEILDHGNADSVNLTRLNEIGVLLFNHNRDDAIGRIDRAWIDGFRGYAEVTFDSDEFAERIFQKVKAGSLRGVSVGYLVDAWEEVRSGKTSSDARFSGPCQIARVWTPYELSIVTVPADSTVGVGRSFNSPATDMSETYQRQAIYNQNIFGRSIA